MSVRLKIMSAIEKVAREHDRPLAPLTDDLVLLESGLDSLSLAVIVVRLEDELMVDPFTNTNVVDFPVTLGDLVTAYERAVESAASVKRAEKSHRNAGPSR
jgi:acyl carrier protein